MKRIGHTSVYRGKKVILFFHSGERVITKFIEKKGCKMITEAGTFSTAQVYNLAIYKPLN